MYPLTTFCKRAEILEMIGETIYTLIKNTRRNLRRYERRWKKYGKSGRTIILGRGAREGSR